MKKDKSQHYNFTHEAVPILFHNNSEEFFKYLDKDGIKFLEFYWKHLEVNLGVKQVSYSKGMQFKTKILDNNTKIAIITMPEPQSIGEVYYLILVKFPKKFKIINVGFTRVFSLENEGFNKFEELKTGIYELTPKARNVRVKDGKECDFISFYQAVMDILKINDGATNEF